VLVKKILNIGGTVRAVAAARTRQRGAGSGRSSVVAWREQRQWCERGSVTREWRRTGSGMAAACCQCFLVFIRSVGTGYACYEANRLSDQFYN